MSVVVLRMVGHDDPTLDAAQRRGAGFRGGRVSSAKLAVGSCQSWTARSSSNSLTAALSAQGWNSWRSLRTSSTPTPLPVCWAMPSERMAAAAAASI